MIFSNDKRVKFEDYFSESMLDYAEDRDKLILPTHWSQRLPLLFPDYCDKPFADRHASFWEWGDSLTQDNANPIVLIWPRGGGKSTSTEMFLADAGIRDLRLYAWYVSCTQDSADKHLLSVQSMLESPQVERYAPEMSKPKLSKTNNQKGWRRSLISTASGFTAESVGLDKAIRGGKWEFSRPGIIILDDLDEKHDTEKTIQKKIETITTSILPAGASNCIVIFVQNLIHSNSIASRLANVSDYKADFLLNRFLSGPHKAIDNLTYELHYDEDIQQQVPLITGGTATWEGQPLELCQHQMTTWGISAFLKEAQNEVVETGEFFKREWLQYVDEVPAHCRFIRGWDMANTEGGGDYTAGGLVGRVGGSYYITDMVRGQWASGNRNNTILATAKGDRPSYKGVGQLGEEEGGYSGGVAADAFKTLLRGYNPSTQRVTGSKELRADGLRAEMENKNVYIVRGEWNAAYVSELMSFPNGAHDDQIDATTLAFNALSRKVGAGMANRRNKVKR